MNAQATDGSPNARGYRLGLALSGGGFRASFFHIGVLARLAELDLLRQVEVISTVSGGSILGALYYLHVRNLLQSKTDDQIQCQDYVRLVDDLRRDFQDAVRKNLRMRTFGNPWKNWKMYSRNYSRSDRIAELYTHYLYAPVVEPALRPHVFLSGLRIRPCGEEPDFHPFDGEKEGSTANYRRQNKVPVLIINATTLNTGHNFQFTATWMGEPPPQRVQGDLDKNSRLRRAYYITDNLAPKYRDLPLGVAVAASATVPAIFPPLALTELYPDMTPQLVDGGVHDNQGIEGLLDSNCTHLLVSDASGQMGDEPEPKTRAWATLKRSNDVMMDRVREEEYKGLTLGRSTGDIREFIFLHLKEGLQQTELTWIHGHDKEGQVVAEQGLAPHGVDREVQRKLADIRTDLDSFTEVEAHALMADGYLIAKRLIDQGGQRKLDPQGISKPLASIPSWEFLDIMDYLSKPQKSPQFIEQLKVGGTLLFKVWQLLPWLKWSGIVVLAVLVGFLGQYLLTHASEPVPYVEGLAKRVSTFGALGVTLLTLGLYGLSYLLPGDWRWVLSLQRLPRRLVLGIGTAIFASIGVWIHLWIFDRLYLWQGRLARLHVGPEKGEGGSVKESGRPPDGPGRGFTDDSEHPRRSR